MNAPSNGSKIQSTSESLTLLRAIIFDFDGIIVDSEPIIMRLTQQMGAQEGWEISDEEYYSQYLALDDRGIVEYLFQSHGRPIDAIRRDELVAWKSREYQEAIRDGLPAFPGAVEFVLKVSHQFTLAVASGSARLEIEHLLAKLGLREKFAVLATAEDAERSKPNPEVYLKALSGLRETSPFRKHPLKATECLAIEDAPGGIDAAHAAGIKCLAIAHSRPAKELQHADWVYKNFKEIDLAVVAAAF